MINLGDNKTDWWEELSDERKAYLESVIEESEDEKNLIPIEKALEEIKEWVKELSFRNPDKKNMVRS